jgi:Fe-S oxidoreductase
VAADGPLPHTARSALAQIHCHHHAVIKPQSEKRILERLGVACEFLPSGCCDMAGSFGFESEKYDVSMTAAERVLLPRVRAAAPETILLANGFSCREQIEQATGRKTTHIAELISQSL